MAKVMKPLVCALFCSAFISVSHGTLVLAQSPEAAALAAGIPPEPLGQALEAFAHQSGTQIVYLSEVVTDQQSPGAPAGLEPEDALIRLLKGTGLQFAFLSPHIVRILAADTLHDDVLDEIVVTARAYMPRYAPASLKELSTIQGANEDLEQRITRSQLLYRNAALDQYLQQIAERLLAVDATDASFVHVRVLKSTEANAFALSNGSVYMTTALIAALDNESQLAGVLAHELTHYTNAHVLRGMREEKRAEIASLSATALTAAALGVVAARTHVSLPNSAIDQSATPRPTLALWARASVSGYARDLESEADEGGIRRAALAGYGADAVVNALQRLAAQAPAREDTRLPIYASRARLAARIADDQQALTHQSLARRFVGVIGSGDAGHAQYRSRLGDLPLDQVAIFLQAEQLDRAAAMLAADPAAGDSGRSYFLEGEIERKRLPQTKATMERALAAYERAVTFPDAPVSAYRQAGLLHRLRGESAAAAAALQAYLARAPSAVDAALVRIYLDELLTAQTAGTTP